jgi:hypothetical protein
MHIGGPFSTPALRTGINRSEGCDRMTTFSYPDRFLRDVLSRTRSIAAVGVSPNPVRPSNYVARYLQRRGYRVFPVNPRHAGGEILGERVWPSLAALADSGAEVQMVDIFRRPEEAGGVVDEALGALLGRGLETVWMQIGVVDRAAAARAEAAGLAVVMDRCPKMEHQRLFGELRRAGINTGIVSSRLR